MHLLRRNYNPPTLKHTELYLPDLFEDEEAYWLTAELPGAENDNINIKLEGQQLTISGSLNQKKEDTDDKEQILQRERRTRKFSRTITLTSPVKSVGMKTSFDNGVLEIIISKA